MRLIFDVPRLRGPAEEQRAESVRQALGWVRRRTRLLMAVLVMTWGLICGFVLVAMLLGWRL